MSEGVFWFGFFWVVMPVLAYQERGWLGVFLLLVIYALGIVAMRAVFGAAGRRDWSAE